MWTKKAANRATAETPIVTMAISFLPKRRARAGMKTDRTRVIAAPVKVMDESIEALLK